MPSQDYDAIVVGSGITGLTASKRIAQSGLTVASIEAATHGGLVIAINELDGPIGGSGAELASNLMMEISELGAETLAESVVAIARDGDALLVTTDEGTRRARALIVASGARLRHLGVPGEAEFDYKGVSHCADCDGPMYEGADVLVVGGGDSALQEALALTNYCRTVHIVHRRDQFRARPHFVDAIRERKNVTVWWDAEVEEILGGSTVEKVRIRTSPDGSAREISCAGVFPFVGLEPACGFIPSSIARDARGALVTDGSLQTALPAVYAAGAVRAGYGGTLTDAVGEALAVADTVVQRLRA